MNGVLFIGGPWDGQVKEVPVRQYQQVVEGEKDPVGIDFDSCDRIYKASSYRLDHLRTNNFAYPFYRSMALVGEDGEVFRRVVLHLATHPEEMQG